MGGDGGVIASDRRYMRGAGQADSTGDSKRASKSALAEAEREAQIQGMTTCAITGGKLDYNNVVVCPFGRLYNREAAVEALLRRKTKSTNHKDDATMELGWHVRGLKDLHSARFQLVQKASNGVDTSIPICPITSVELNGIQPAFLIVNGKGKKNGGPSARDVAPNVLSEKAIKEMGIDALQEEYGPFEKDDLIRLVPPSIMLNEIKEKLQAERENAKSHKKKRKKECKGANESADDDGPKRLCVDAASKSI
jgi:hypothetical protein